MLPAAERDCAPAYLFINMFVCLFVCFFGAFYLPVTRKRLSIVTLWIGWILTRKGVADFQVLCWLFVFYSNNLLLVRSHQAEITVVKRLIQGRNNATRVGLEPRLCDHGQGKNGAFVLSSTCQKFLWKN